LFAAALFSIAIGIAGCGGSSPSGQSGASPASSAPASAAAPAAGYAVNLTFTGALAGTTTKAKAPSGHPACGDEVGHILVGVTLNGHDYDFLLTNVMYKTVGKYTLGDAASATQLMFSDGGWGGKTVYFSKSGTVTYITPKSITIDADLAEQSSNQAAHVSGTASCA
jgi:hypothetical protein